MNNCIALLPGQNNNTLKGVSSCSNLMQVPGKILSSPITLKSISFIYLFYLFILLVEEPIRRVNSESMLGEAPGKGKIPPRPSTQPGGRVAPPPGRPPPPRSPQVERKVVSFPVFCLCPFFTPSTHKYFLDFTQRVSKRGIAPRGLFQGRFLRTTTTTPTQGRDSSKSSHYHHRPPSPQEGQLCRVPQEGSASLTTTTTTTSSSIQQLQQSLGR
jgi:hypothetical protein